ncbi:Retrovirus-related Pol poly from transposon [Paramuricea clavata]|uniref:Retrovirus-related Pol poly from transposon, partial n=1 Tax=Paramuricea clavata TaxID=317549 RepID=A0A6S7JQM3_PARCT|nr:Retrovirus-related Pol poly from transposon [Paramuricea clavata]
MNLRRTELKYYDVSEEVAIQCDASEKGLGASLLQNGQPVAFASRTLTQIERRYAQIECLAIVFGCQKFSQYISRRDKVTIESDHKYLQSIFKKSLLEAPCRLQRMMLRLQRYNLEVLYKPGPQMYIADHLSRASVKDTGTPDEDFQVFAVELEGIGPLNTIKISSERLGQLQKAIEQDPVLQTLKATILMGWPTEREEVPIHIREFWTYREELTLHNGVLFKSQRIIIPKAMRTEITSRIHSSHLDIEACLRKARELVSDNGPQYTSREFTYFITEWEIKHVTSSPYHARSNGKSESG